MRESNRFCRILLASAVLGVLAWSTAARAGGGEPVRLVVTGPPEGLMSLPFYRMMETDALTSAGWRLEFLPWKNPDQLRAIVASHQADVFAIHTNVASNLFEHDAPLRLLNVVLWRVLWVVSAADGPEATRLADLRGQKIAVPFKGDLPDIVLRQAATRAGLDADKDLQILYTPSPQDAMQQLLAGRVPHAVLSDPAGAIAVQRSGEPASPGQPAPVRVRRSVDLQAAWAGPGQAGRIPLAGVAVAEEWARAHPAGADALHRAYGAAVIWCREHPKEAAALMARHAPGLPELAIVAAIGSVGYDCVASSDARPEIERFFRAVAESDPAKIGGQLPGDHFYWRPATDDRPTTVSAPAVAR